MKLGKLAPRDDDRTLQLASYLTPALPRPPAGFGVVPSASVKWGMLGNDTVGDCTVAAAAHQDMAWTAATDKPDRVVTTAKVLAAYSAITGYVPGDESTDTGAVELDVLNYWRKHGICGERITGYAKAHPAQARVACWLFGGLYIGLALPLSAQDQHVWDVGVGPDGEPGSWGLHAVPIIGYDHEGLTCITWGAPKRMTWAFYHAYTDECWAVLGGDYINHSGSSPEGFKLSALLADIAAL